MYDYLFFVVLFILPIFFFLRRSPDKRSALVIVQGDLGRSPRMQYHCLSLLNRGFNVTFMGQTESELIPELQKFLTLKVYRLPVCSRSDAKISFLIKAFKQSWYLFWGFLRCEKPSFVLLQNPPCIPTMAICAVFRYLYGFVLLYDWHNYAFSLLALSLGSKRGLLYRVSKRYELFFSQYSDYNFCVSKAMQRDLYENWNVPSIVLYDKAPRRFKALEKDERIDFIRSSGIFSNQIVEMLDKGRDQCLMIVSSTSWTPDEDFSMLLDALVKYNNEARKCELNSIPKIVCVITGKGPQKDFYKVKIAKLNLDIVHFVTPWLEPDDYPKLIGCADLGICLHTSSSGLDLPMKVVDMFGCNLPVCAVKYKCIEELVQHEKTGLLFESSTELFGQLKRIVSELGRTNGLLDRMKSNLVKGNDHRWDQEWDDKVWPVIRNIE